MVRPGILNGVNKMMALQFNIIIVIKNVKFSRITLISQ